MKIIPSIVHTLEEFSLPLPDSKDNITTVVISSNNRDDKQISLEDELMRFN